MNEEILKQFEQRMIEGFASIKELLVKSEDINRKRMTDLKNKIEDQGRRISKLEHQPHSTRVKSPESARQLAQLFQL